MLIHNHEQGSPEWLAARAGVITASRFRDAVDVLKTGKPSAKATAYAAQIAVERVAGVPIDQQFQNWQMRTGTEQEPLARAAYEAETGLMVDECGLITTEDMRFGYSPDGLVGTDGLIEVKTLLGAEQIVKCIARTDIADYMGQCLGGLWLTGRAWCDLVLWCPALAPIGRQIEIHRIERRHHEDAIGELEQQLLAFSREVDAIEASLRG